MKTKNEALGAELIRFDIDLLIAIRSYDGVPMGVEIKENIEERSGREVNNGRLYPRLDKLARDGYVDKSERNGRTNSYALTDKGVSFLRSRRGELNLRGI